MEQILGILAIFFAAGMGILLIRAWCYKKQIDHIRKQLLFLETEDSNFLLTSVCAVGKTKEVIRCLNRVLEKLRGEVRSLQRTNQSYRESITSISHDIRTPLTSIKGYIQILKKSDASPEKKAEYLRVVERRLEELNCMLNQLFEYARLEAGEICLHMEKFHVGNLFAEIISMFYEDFSTQGQEPIIEIAPRAMYIQGDKHAFSRILENLIKNTLVHGMGKYYFSVESKNGHAVICIANETDCIDKKDLERIFERFYTTDQSRGRRTTGLGLAIAKEFTIQMGGSIQAYLKKGYFIVEVCFPLIEQK